jgi:hypothetical protein
MGHIPSWIGTRVGDRVGMDVGTICDVYYDEATSRPVWFLVDSARGPVLVPADGALIWSERVVVPHDRDLIAMAPVVASPPAMLIGEPLLRMARHYGVRVDRSAGCTAVHGPARVAQAA